MPASQAGLGGGKVRPGIERMPGAGDFGAILGRERRPSEFHDQFVEHATMHVIDIEVRTNLPGHHLERPPPVFVGRRRPVGGNAAPGSRGGQGSRNAAVPVEDRAAGVEGQGFDRQHHFSRRVAPRRPGWPGSSTGRARASFLRRAPS